MTWDDMQDCLAEKMLVTAKAERKLALMRDGVTGFLPQPSGEGRPRSPGSIEAERLLRAGMNRLAVRQATGMSRTVVQRLDDAIRKESNTA